MEAQDRNSARLAAMQGDRRRKRWKPSSLFGRIVLALVLLVVVLAMLMATAWAALALSYRLPAAAGIRNVTAIVFALLGLAAAIAVIARRGFVLPIVFLLAFGAVLVWWSTIKPPADADWAPDVARQVTGTVDGNMLTLTNVRNFDWHPDGTATPNWTSRTYDLTKLKTLDLFMSYWAGPEMAHVILSFGFEGDDYLAWSIEVRRRAGGAFSPLADLFKSNPLVIVAADERDVVRVRSNVRGEDVQLFRLNTPPDDARKLLLEYVADANALSETPQFYNSITTNCTTTIVKMIRAVGARVAFDWRLIVNGYLPEFVYERGTLDTALPFRELKTAAHIDDKARAAGNAPDYSRLIRIGVPAPGVSTGQ